MESERDLKQTLGLPDSVWLGQVAIDYAQQQLGVGSDAIVYRCVHDGVPVAAKVLHSALIAPNNVGRNDFIANFGRECSRLRQLAHPCVVSFIGVGQAPNKAPCLVVELMEESLADRMKAEPADPVLQSLIYLMDVAGGLRYLHWQLLVHRDLKPQNILLAAGRAKIADVGLARSLHGDEGMAEQVMTRCPGTPNYMAPESLEEGKPYDDKLDMFALGAIILGVINHREPRPKVKEIRILARGRRVAMTELERRADDLGRMDVNHPTRPLVVSCLQDEPALRPTATQAHHQLMIIHHGFAGADKPLLSATLTEVVGRLDTLATSHQEQISLLGQEIRSQQATAESVAVVRAAEVGQLRQQVERQHQQMERQHQEIERQQRQNQQMELQQRQHQEQLASLRQEILSQQATTESARVARAAEVLLRPRRSERRLNWEMLRDMVSKRQEVSECIAELQSPGHHGVIIAAFLMHVIESKPEKQALTGELVLKLMTEDGKNTFAASDVISGVMSFLQYADDFAVDIPMFWNYLGNFLAPIVIHFPDVLAPISACSHLKDMKTVATFVVEVLKAIRSSQKKEEAVISKVWSKCKLSWSAMLLPHEPKEKAFLAKHGLPFLESNDELTAKMSEMLKDQPTNEAVFEWVEQNVESGDRRSKPFIQALFTAIVQPCICEVPPDVQNGTISPTFKVDEKAIVQHSKVFIKYIDTNMDLQLYGLLAVQAIVSKLEHPPGLLNNLFSLLYGDCDAMEEETFLKWEKLQGEETILGHGVAVQSARGFLTFLRSAETAT